jgi:hypothetical protein
VTRAISGLISVLVILVKLWLITADRVVIVPEHPAHGDIDISQELVWYF